MQHDSDALRVGRFARRRGIAGRAVELACVTIALWSCGCAPNSDAATEPNVSADSSSSAAFAPKYAGLTLEEWRTRIKALDPKSPSAAESVPGLMEIVRDRTAPPAMRQQAALTLGRIGAPARDAAPLLVQVLDEPTTDGDSPSLWGAKSLAYLGPSAAAAAPDIIARIGDSARPANERLALFEPLGKIGTAHPAVLPRLIELLQARTDGNRAVQQSVQAFRIQSAGAIAQIGEQAGPATPALVRALDDSDPELRLAALGALGALKVRGEIAVPQIADRLLFDESPVVRDAAGVALSQIGPASAPVLVQMMASSDVELRRRVCQALGAMRPETTDATRVLREAVNDQDATVRLIAAEALWKLHARADEVLPALVRGVVDADRNVRLRSTRAFRALGSAAKSAIPELRQLAADKSPAIRQAVERTIQEIEKTP